MSEQSTVRVRIAVAVDADGNWCSAGWGGPERQRDEEFMLSCALDGLDGDGQFTGLRWIEADVPLPLPPQTIQGDVSGAT